MLPLHECADPAPTEPLHSVGDSSAVEPLHSAAEPLQSIADSDAAVDAPTETYCS
jgi:hypothetical protein